MELLKAFIIERLTVAAGEIFGAVQKTIAECQEEVDRTKEENARLQRLESKPELKREPQNHGAEEEALGQQLCEQEYRIILDQENPETIVKEEQEELWATKEEEQLPGLDSDTKDLVLTSPCVRTDFDQVLPQPEIKTGPDGDDYGEQGTTSDSLLLSVVNPDSTDGVQSSGLLQSVPLIPRRTESPSDQGKRFQCKVCGKCFNWKSVLDRHVMIHTGEKPFKCKECGKCFNRTGVLDRHMLTHTGDKPFKCKECGKCFCRDHHLSDHMMIHTGDKPFKCKTCGKSFNRKYNLNCHESIHMD